MLERPALVLALIAIVTGFFAWYAPTIDLDASADSLLLEDDVDLRYYRAVAARYGALSYLVITYTPDADLFAPASLTNLQALRNQLLELERVTSVITVLDVPLINSPRITLTGLQNEVPTLLSERTDVKLAEKELVDGELYSELLMSRDGRTTALLVSFTQDPQLVELLQARDVLREKNMSGDLTPAEQAEVDELSDRIQQINVVEKARQADDIEAVRAILKQHEDRAELRLGGVPMIVADMIELIKKDVVVFGAGILLFLIVLLAYLFRQPRWVIVSMLCCLTSVVIMVGMLGLLQWRVTVVSSNFIALVLIFSLAVTVHLIVRYRELQRRNPMASQRWLVRNTLSDKFEPCVYTVLTTMVGFASLLVSGIRPVIDFGWMMVIGMGVVFATSFVLFPAALMFLQPRTPSHGDATTTTVTRHFAQLVRFASGGVLSLFAALLVFSAIGISRLEVENRFLDYFAKSTEIYKGLATIDRELGGTMPFDVVLDAAPEFYAGAQPAAEDGFVDEFDEDAGSDPFADDFGAGDFAAAENPDGYQDEFGDEFEDEFGDEFGGGFEDDFDTGGTQVADLGADSYWYNSYRLGEVRAVHDYLDSLSETGKVMSMATTLEALETLNNDEMPGTFFLSILYTQLPPSIKQALFDPYISADGNQVRLSVRVYESNPELRRGPLLEQIRSHLVDEMGFAPEQVHITGMLVLYNNVLQSLFKSQILTIGAVFLAILLMYLVLFRSLKVAVVAVVPSMVAAAIVLGSMGWLGLPLDIMSITIAAITIGIGVDDSIHYVHRYREEVAIDGDPVEAMERSHGSIGRAIYYTSVIITAGFSILAISDFIPTIYFGLFTGLAMLLALIANLTLLPVLLIRAKVT